MVVEAHGKYVIGCTECNKRFNKFISADLDVRRKERRRPQKWLKTTNFKLFLKIDG